MLQYKRNQIEEALSRILEGPIAKPSSELRTRVKRLLDLDRSLGRNLRSMDPEAANYAFFTGESPGRGTEVRFLQYEAFALMTGLRLLRHGWPQSFAVRIMRRFRSELEREHARILRQDPTVLFDEKTIRQNAHAGSIAFDNTDPVMLIVISGRWTEQEDGSESQPCSICRGMQQVAKFLKQESAQAWSAHELVTPAHKLSEQLSKVKARKRGRGA